MEHDEALEGESGRYKSKVRFATVDDLIFAHSGFFTAELDAVPFGPDAYRFVRLLRASLADVPSGGPLRLVDIGSGSGAGGIAAARLLGKHTDKPQCARVQRSLRGRRPTPAPIASPPS